MSKFAHVHKIISNTEFIKNNFKIMNQSILIFIHLTLSIITFLSILDITLNQKQYSFLFFFFSFN